MRARNTSVFPYIFPQIFVILFLWQNDGLPHNTTANFKEKVISMITNDDILNMNFYKKEKFTGSYCGMHYLIKKDTEASADIFRATIWPGPYNFATTPDEKKQSETFPFTPEGKEQVVAWLNEQWLAQKGAWPER